MIKSYRSVVKTDYADEITRLPDDPWLNPAAREGAMRGDHNAMMRAMMENAMMIDEGIRLDPTDNPLALFFRSALPWNHI